MPAEFGNHPGQIRAWNSTKRIVAICAGWQSGKTVIGPPWLIREIARRGPGGDHGVIAPNYPLLGNKALPELRARLAGYARYLKSDNVFEITEEGAQKLWGKPGTARILLRHADRPEAIEAFTAKSLWCDEPGQISDEVWEGIQARCAVEQARILLTSRPYKKNWFVTQIWDRRLTDEQLDVINFRSIDNPAFPKEEYERQKLRMPAWKFSLKYDGIPTKPAGIVYDIVERARHEMPAGFAVDPAWRRFVWLDFGSVNTGALKVAEERREGSGSRYYIYGAYKPGVRRTAGGPDGHVHHLRKGEPMMPFGIGGSHQEDGWRESWSQAGLPVSEPAVNKLDVQIAQTYALFAEDRLMVLHGLDDFWEELEEYAWPVGDNGEVERDEKPENDQKYHLMAALRYGASTVNPPGPAELMTDEAAYNEFWKPSGEEFSNKYDRRSLLAME